MSNISVGYDDLLEIPEHHLRNRIIAVALVAAIVAGATYGVYSMFFSGGGTTQAQAQTKPVKKRTVVYTERTTTRVAARPSVTVRKRSYLDAGTEVKQGERKYLDYAFPPGYSPFDVFDGSRILYGRSTLPDRFWLPGSGLNNN